MAGDQAGVSTGGDTPGGDHPGDGGDNPAGHTPPEVKGRKIDRLPTTGTETPILLAGGIWFLAAGALLTVKSRRGATIS